MSFSLETVNLCEDVLGFCQKQIIRDLVLSCIVIEKFYLSIHVDNLFDRIWKLVNLVSNVSQQRGSPWLDALVIFHNNRCLLELRGVWHIGTEFAILLRNYTHAFSTGIDSGGYSYCCDFSKSS